MTAFEEETIELNAEASHEYCLYGSYDGEKCRFWVTNAETDEVVVETTVDWHEVFEGKWQ